MSTTETPTPADVAGELQDQFNRRTQVYAPNGEVKGYIMTAENGQDALRLVHAFYAAKAGGESLSVRGSFKLGVFTPLAPLNNTPDMLLHRLYTAEHDSNLSHVFVPAQGALAGSMLEVRDFLHSAGDAYQAKAAQSSAEAYSRA